MTTDKGSEIGWEYAFQVALRCMFVHLTFWAVAFWFASLGIFLHLILIQKSSPHLWPSKVFTIPSLRDSGAGLSWN
jgi:hypothetical protein